MAAAPSRLRTLFMKYGSVGIAVHLTIYAATLTGCTLAVSQSSSMKGLMYKYGLVKPHDEAAAAGGPEQAPPGRLAEWMGAGGSSFVLGFVATKALFPVRGFLTVGLTPIIARSLPRAWQQRLMRAPKAGDAAKPPV